MSDTQLHVDVKEEIVSDSQDSPSGQEGTPSSNPHFHNDQLMIDQKLEEGVPGLDQASAVKSEAGEPKKSYNALKKFIKTLVADHPNSEVQCQLCGKQLKVVEKARMAWDKMKMINHASTHLETALFQCLLCDSKFITKNGVDGHIKGEHQSLAKKDETFKDMLLEHEDEVKLAIKSCFGEGTGIVDDTKISSHAVQTLRALASGSQRKLQLLSRVSKIIEKSISAGKTIKCRECSKEIAEATTTSALIHAKRHINKPMHKCKLCNKTFFNHSHILRHLRRSHKASMAENHEDLSDQMDDEITEMVMKCFGD